MLAVDILAVVVAAAGLIYAHLANGHAKKADERSKTANDLAAKAVTQAREANRIAEEANQLAENANTVIERQAARETERWYVDWHVEWDKERSVLITRNTGADVALNLSVVAKSRDIHRIYEGLGDVAAGEQVELPLMEIFEKRAEHIADRKRTQRELAGSGIFFAGSSFSRKVAVVFNWSTGQGAAATKTIEESLD